MLSVIAATDLTRVINPLPSVPVLTKSIGTVTGIVLKTDLDLEKCLNFIMLINLREIPMTYDVWGKGHLTSTSCG